MNTSLREKLLEELNKVLQAYAGWMSQEDYQKCVQQLNNIRDILRGSGIGLQEGKKQETAAEWYQRHHKSGKR